MQRLLAGFSLVALLVFVLPPSPAADNKASSKPAAKMKAAKKSGKVRPTTIRSRAKAHPRKAKASQSARWRARYPNVNRTSKGKGSKGTTGATSPK